MSTRQTKKRKGRNVNNRERTVTTFTEDPNTSFLVPLPSEEPPQSLASPFAASSFAMPYQNYMPPQQQQFYQPILPPGKNDLEILENLKNIIREGQHEFYRAVPQPAALASLYLGHVSQSDPLQQEYSSHRFSSADVPNDAVQSHNNTAEPNTPGPDTSPLKLGAEGPNIPDPNPESEDVPRMTQQGPPADANAAATGEYSTADAASPTKATPLDTKDDEPTQENAWERRALDDRKARYDDHNANLASRAPAYDARPANGDAHLPPAEDRRFYDRDRDGDRGHWDRDRDRDSIRDFRDRRDVRDRRPEFFGRSYGRSHAPRPPPELRHYEPSYGDDYVPPPRRYDSDDRRVVRNTSFDDRSKPAPFDDRRPPLDDRRPPPSTDADRRLPLDDRPMRRLPGSSLLPSSDDRTRPVTDTLPPTRATAEDDRSARATPLAADERPRGNVPLEERLSQPATAAPSLQDRLSQPVTGVAPGRADLGPAPSLEERLSSGPVPPRAYQRAASVARDDLRVPLPKDDPRDHDRSTDFRPNRDFSRDRLTASTYRPDMDRSFGDRDDRDRRERDVANVDAPPARYNDTFSRPGPPPPRRFSPPPATFDRDRERRGFYPTPSSYRGEGVYDPDGDRRYATDRERDTYEQRRRDWYGPTDDDKRGPPPGSWRPNDRPTFVDRDRERFDRERERERDFRERDRDPSGIVPPPPPGRGHWEDRDRRPGFPTPPPPPSRIDTTGVGPGRSLSARLTDPYPPPPPSGDDRAYPPRDFDRGRYGGPPDDHTHGHVPPAFSRIRNRSPSPPRRAPGLAEDLRPPVKRAREDGASYAGGGYSPPRRGASGGEYVPGPPPSSAATTMTMTSAPASSVPARPAGTGTPPVSAPAGGAFYERDREREREYVREYAGYEREERGRRSPPMVGRMGYSRGVVGDRRDERRYPMPPRTS